MFAGEVSPDSLEWSGESISSCKTALVENKSLVQTNIKDYFSVVSCQTIFRPIHWATFHSVVPGVSKILKKTTKIIRQTLIKDFFIVFS